MKRFSRARLGLLAVAVATSALAGSTAAYAAQRPNAAHRPVTLNALFPAAAGPTSPYTPMIAEFNKAYPYIKLNVTFVPVANYWTLLQTQLQSGNGPDLYETRPGTGQLGSVQLFAKAGYVANLSSSPWTHLFLPGLKSGITYSKKIVALPLGMQIQGLSYNRATFHQLGLKVPTTFAQMLSVCRRLVSAGKTPIAFPAGSITYDQVMGIARAISDVYSSDPGFNRARAKGTTTFTKSATWARALRSISQMNNAGCFGQAPAALQPAAALAGVLNGQYTMIFGPSVLAGDLEAENSALNIGVFAIPPDKATHAVIPVSANEQLSANAHSKNLASAETFINWLGLAKNQVEWSKISGTVSPYSSSSKKVPPQLTDLASLLQRGKIIAGPQDGWPNPTIYSVALANGVQGLLTGQNTVAQVLQSMDSAW